MSTKNSVGDVGKVIVVQQECGDFSHGRLPNADCGLQPRLTQSTPNETLEIR